MALGGPRESWTSRLNHLGKLDIKVELLGVVGCPGFVAKGANNLRERLIKYCGV